MRVGVAARLLAPLAIGVESRDMLGVGVTSSLSGESRMVRSSHEAHGAASEKPAVIGPVTGSVRSPLTTIFYRISF